MMEWLELFCLLIANSLVIFGINKATYCEYCHPDEDREFCTEEGIDKDSRMVLYKLRHWSLTVLGPFWSKPLFICPPCMASVWGTAFFIFTAYPMWMWPVYILMLSGLVTLINSSINGGT
jgi:hypothetical protein